VVETSRYAFTHKDVAAALVKAAGLHEGIWGLSVEFGIQAINIGVSNKPGPDLVPAAIIPIIGFGLQRFEEENGISVDAAEVNPPARKKPKQPQAR